MRSWRWVLLAAMVSAGCSNGPQRLTSARTVEIDREVRAFAQDVERGVTREGPTAWQRYFSESPEFFMAAEGRLAFSNGASAIAAMPDLARAIKQIDLKWGEDLRVDPLAPDLAVMAVPYREVRTGPTGDRISEAGYFTATTEFKGGHWQFRNAHWSVVVPPVAVR
ncbi:MAG TPA: hypothetical protein VHW09_25495 [Bryobacteraceae bacterium]|nr:hypothetical protein [Bryobacteraceae bacterium]